VKPQKVHRKPTLLCLNNGTNTLTRYVPKPAGGFFTEVFEITDRAEFDKATTPQTMENVRLGKMAGQETPPELVDQPEMA
jgi:hypothetical protein